MPYSSVPLGAGARPRRQCLADLRCQRKRVEVDVAAPRAIAVELDDVVDRVDGVGFQPDHTVPPAVRRRVAPDERGRRTEVVALNAVGVSGLLCCALQPRDRLGDKHALEPGRELPAHHGELHGTTSKQAELLHNVSNELPVSFLRLRSARLKAIFYDLALGEADNRDASCSRHFACGRSALILAVLRAPCGPTISDLVAFGDHFVNREMDIWEGRAKVRYRSLKFFKPAESMERVVRIAEFI